MSAKLFLCGLRKGKYKVDMYFRCKVDSLLIFIHHHAFGQTEGDLTISKNLKSECLLDLKIKFHLVFLDPKFLIIRDDSLHFEYKIRLKDEGAPLPHRKITHLIRKS